MAVQLIYSDEWGNALCVGEFYAGDAIEMIDTYGPVDLVWMMPPSGTERDEELAGRVVEVVGEVGRGVIVGTVEAAVGWMGWLGRGTDLVVRGDPGEGAVLSGDVVSPNGSGTSVMLDRTEAMVVLAGERNWVRSLPPDPTGDPLAHYLGAAGSVVVAAPFGGAVGVAHHIHAHGGAMVAMFENEGLADLVIRSYFGH